MYRPIGATEITELPQVRLGIQGYPKTGKTYGALTFPNPIVANLDRGLGAHIGKGILELPFWDPKFCDSIYQRTSGAFTPNRRDAFKKWLQTEAQKLEKDQTLIIDGSTGLQNAFHTQAALEPVYTKSGKKDDFAEWQLKVQYFGEVMETLKSLKCHVVYICHETPDRNKEGELNGKLRPMLTGQFGDQLGSHFTDWFRQHAFAKQADLAKVNLTNWGMTLNEFKALSDSFEGNEIYAWQTRSDDLANCGTTTLVGQPRYIKSEYSSIIKYSRHKISQ